MVAAEKQTLEELLLHLEGAVRDVVESRGISRFESLLKHLYFILIFTEAELKECFHYKSLPFA